jgi:hypothetical protein
MKRILLLTTAIFAVSTVAFAQTKPEVKPSPTAVFPAKKEEAKTVLPTAAQILEKYFVALGGRAANEKLTTRVMRGTVEIPAAGIKGTFESYSKSPNKTFAVMTLPGVGDIVSSVDGATGWTSNPIQGSRDLQGEELSSKKRDADFLSEFNLAKTYPKMEVKSTEKIGANEVYVVSAATAEGAAVTFYFDAKTGLMLRRDQTETSPEGKIPVQLYFEDFRDVDGVKLPFTTRQVAAQGDAILRVTEVKHNVVIDDAKFAKPKAQ